MTPKRPPWTFGIATALASILLPAAPGVACISNEPLEECMKPRPPARQRLAREIRAWRPGRPIPPEALRLVGGRCVCFASETDSHAVMNEATNYGFLLALATDRKADPAIVNMAVERALLLRGPTKAFADLAARYRADASLLELRVHRSIHARMQRRYVWVRGIELKPRTFREAGLGEEQAGVVAMEMARRLRRGEEWARLYDEYRNRYRWPNGCPLIWDAAYVAWEARDAKAPRDELPVPSYHLPRLLRARAGDALVLTVRPTAWDYTWSLFLWQVLDVYEPGPDPSESGGSRLVSANTAG